MMVPIPAHVDGADRLLELDPALASRNTSGSNSTGPPPPNALPVTLRRPPPKQWRRFILLFIHPSRKHPLPSFTQSISSRSSPSHHCHHRHLPSSASMPATDYLARSLLSIRRDQQHQIEPEPDAFQNRLADLFYDLAVSHSDKDQLLSIGWTRRLLEAFHICLEDFRAVVLHRRGEVAPPGPPLERLAAEFSDRSVRALDACNAALNGIERLRQRQRLAQIVHVALASPRKQLQRAKKALSELAAVMAEDKDDAGPTLPWHRHWPSHSRSHSWGGSSAWSAARQHIVDGGGGGRLAAALCAMNWLLVFVGWALVAAVPGQDRSLQGQHLSFPRGLPWAAPAAILQERIAAESKKRRSTGSGLLREAQKMERCVRQLAELEDEAETEERVRELAQVCESMSEGLDPLERLVRTAFHEIVCSREETLTCLHHGPVD